ncbi:MAG: hypothetical protein LBL60_03925 [Mycoplasmataceae bacterium]|jgi:hypothetical protein|nr:hypothetical protein [Mycoplasmataceae bacterium]
MTQIDLFKRECNNDKYFKFVNLISKKLNVNNFFHTTKHIIKKMFQINLQKEYRAYRFSLLSYFVYHNELYTQTYVDKLEHLIKTLCLDNELNTNEQEYIIHFKNTVFAQIRNLKNLIVDFECLPKEEVYYKYRNIDIYVIKDQQKQVVTKNNELFITTKRLLIDKANNLFEINLKDITSIFPTNDYLQIKTIDKEFYIQTPDPYILYVSLERIFKLNKINV